MNLKHRLFMLFLGTFFVLFLIYLRFRSRFVGPIFTEFDPIQFITYSLLLTIFLSILLIYIYINLKLLRIKILYHSDPQNLIKKDKDSLNFLNPITRFYKYVDECLKAFFTMIICLIYYKENYNLYYGLQKNARFIYRYYKNIFSWAFPLISLGFPMLVAFAFFIDTAIFREFYYFPKIAFILIFTLFNKGYLYFLAAAQKAFDELLKTYKITISEDKRELTSIRCRVEDHVCNESCSGEKLLAIGKEAQQLYLAIRIHRHITWQLTQYYREFRFFFIISCYSLGYISLLDSMLGGELYNFFFY